MMLFAVVFGLSMDYEVFLLSRIREEWHRTGDSRTSVADGLAATAKVITAAAAIMVVVFGSFMLEFERTMKMMGTGLAVAILFDATIVRMVLVPATMELLGDRNWWLPRWLDRILPNLDVEGHAEDGGTDRTTNRTRRSASPPSPTDPYGLRSSSSARGVEERARLVGGRAAWKAAWAWCDRRRAARGSCAVAVVVEGEARRGRPPRTSLGHGIAG